MPVRCEFIYLFVSLPACNDIILVTFLHMLFTEPQNSKKPVKTKAVTSAQIARSLAKKTVLVSFAQILRYVSLRFVPAHRDTLSLPRLVSFSTWFPVNKARFNKIRH